MTATVTQAAAHLQRAKAARAPVRIGTRGSALALVQARFVAAALGRKGVATEIVVIETAGDRRAPDTTWGEGAFVKAIQEAILDGRVDLAIHSAKDVPTETHPRLLIGAYLQRADPRDCVVTRIDEPIESLDDLPPAARVGTDSPRRTGFLLARRPDLVVAPLHGNVDTRLRRLDAGEADALILAVAGLTRLGREDRIGLILEPTILPPAAGQGALAVELRADDAALREMIALIDHRPTRTAVEAERAVLAASGGGCRSPIGAFGRVLGRQLILLAGYAAVDGSTAAVIEARGSAVESSAMIRSLVGRLEAAVGVRVAGRARPRVLVTRPAGQAAELVQALATLGMDGVVVPALEVERADGAHAKALAAAARHVDWVVITSANAVEAVAALLEGRADGANGANGADGAAGATETDGNRPRWAAVGAETAAALRERGAAEVWTPSTADGRTLANELPIDIGARVLVARTPLADPALTARLRERGAAVSELDAYGTRLAPEASRELLRDALAGPGGVEAVTFLSASAVRGLVDVAGAELADECRALLAVCIGSGTAAVARELGFTSVVESTQKSVGSVAELAATRLGLRTEEARA